MTEPLRIFPPPELPEWVERNHARQEAYRRERESWTGRPSREPVHISEALQSLAEHDFIPPRRKARPAAEKEAYADHLRANMTRAEWVLWEWLRGFELDFEPQVVVHGWIADFYSPQLGLVIEVDGSAHASPHRLEQDKEREGSLERHGLRVLRLTNQEVLAGKFTRLLLAIGGNLHG